MFWSFGHWNLITLELIIQTFSSYHVPNLYAQTRVLFSKLQSVCTVFACSITPLSSSSSSCTQVMLDVHKQLIRTRSTCCVNGLRAARPDHLLLCVGVCLRWVITQGDCRGCQHHSIISYIPNKQRGSEQLLMQRPAVRRDLFRFKHWELEVITLPVIRSYLWHQKVIYTLEIIPGSWNWNTVMPGPPACWKLALCAVNKPTGQQFAVQE